MPLGLGDRRETLSAKVALKINDNSVLVRRGAAESLGYFFEDSDAKEGLNKLMEDSNEDVRFAVLKAVASRGGPGRLKYFKKLEQEKKTWSELEKVGIYRGILRLSSPEEKGAALSPLLATYKASKDQKVKFYALMDMMAVLPRDPRVLELVKAMRLNERSHVASSRSPSYRGHSRQSHG